MMLRAIRMKSYSITNVTACEVFNGNWTPTIEVTICVGKSVCESGIAPMGRSTGSNEAVEVRDRGLRYDGFGCLTAVNNIETILRDRLIGMDVTQQEAIDAAIIDLDGTSDKSRLGSNTITAVSAAVTAAAAKVTGLPIYKYIHKDAHVLPVPMMDFISGAHYSFGATSMIQEYGVLPIGASSFSQALEYLYRFYSSLRTILIKKYGALAQCVDAAGTFAVPIKKCRGNLDLLLLAAEKSGLSDKLVFGLDCAANTWYDRQSNLYCFEDERLNRTELLSVYKDLIKDYPIVSLEDPFAETDIDGFVLATKTLGIQIVGDDLFTTNPVIINAKAPLGAGNALLWKYNQIGTLTEAYKAATAAKKNGYSVMVSARSEENEDSIAADLAVALNAGQCKFGICIRTENVSKYNRLLVIEKQLGDEAVYPGRNVLNGRACFHT